MVNSVLPVKTVERGRGYVWFQVCCAPKPVPFPFYNPWPQEDHFPAEEQTEVDASEL